MKLFIDTCDKTKVKLALGPEGEEGVHIFAVNFDQAERLLPEIEGFLAKNKVKLGDLTEIVVNNAGDSFTSLRIGVTTANALAFALNIPVKPMEGESKGKYVVPKYGAEPNIS